MIHVLLSPRRLLASVLAGALAGGMVLAMPAAGAAAGMAAADPDMPAGAVIDQFTATTLNPAWEVVNPLPANWSLTSAPGSLQIIGTAGDTYQTAPATEAKNLFFQSIPAGDFVVQTKVSAATAQDFQGAGIYAWSDTDNYVRVGLTNVGFADPATTQDTVIENGYEVAASYTSTFTARPLSVEETLRVSRVGNVITTAYWSDPNWVTTSTTTVPFTTTKVGLYSFGAQDGTPLTANFDYFAVVKSADSAIVPAGTFSLENSSPQGYLAAAADGSLTLSGTRPATSARFTASASGVGIQLKAAGSTKVLAVGSDGKLYLTATPTGDSAVFALRDQGAGVTALFSLATGSATAQRVGVLNGSLTVDPAAAVVTMKSVAYTAADRTLDIHSNGTGVGISDDMYGIFYEDINYAADGGLYAELVRNRSFEFNASDRNGYTGLTGWAVAQRGGATGTATVVTDANMLNAMNRYYLQMNLTAAGTGAAAGVGVVNSSWNTGFRMESGKTYDFSVWARRTADFDKPLKVQVEDATGATVFAQGQVVVTSDAWTKYTVQLTATAATTTGRLSVIAEGGPGTVRLDMVSLFPTDTYKGRPNGLRKDLAEKIETLNPKFVRFPGGCVTNVGTFRAYGENGTYDRKRTYQWKETVGPVEERPTNYNFWSYNQTYGLGYLEYFQFAEDLGAEPLPVLSVGLNGCGGAAPNTYTFDIARWVQDTLDLIEFANGDATTTWGAKRIAMGHPQPFNLTYLGLGNEENFTAQFKINFPQFQDAIKAVYPNIKIISNTGPDSSGTTFDTLWAFNRERNVEYVDEHYYRDPSWFFQNNMRYDSYPRTGPKVFLGEYASRGNTLYNALSEASYMTALERNADVVRLASYAPLLAMDHPSFAPQWTPDMIWFDNSRIYGSANYYVQQLFMNNVGNETVPSTYTAPPAPLPAISGGIALSTWSTAATYDDVKVTNNADGMTLFADDFAGDATKWSGTTGTWAINGAGEYEQTSTTVTDARRTVNVAGAVDWSNYTLELKAKKTAGAEGFLVGFGVKNSTNYYWWNLGGFANARSLVEKAVNGTKTEIVGSTTKITTGQTYAVKIVVANHNVKLYLDNVLVNEFTEPSTIADPLYQVVTRDTDTGDLIVKVVNVRAQAVHTTINVDGDDIVGDSAQVSELTGARTDANTMAQPTKVATKYATITGTSNSFAYDFPADSVTFIRLNTTDEPVDVPTTTTLAVNPTSYAVNTSSTATVTVTGAGATGTVTLLEGDTVIGTGTLVDGTATITVTGLAVGTHDLHAVYAGSTGVEGSMSTTVRVTVNFTDVAPGRTFYDEIMWAATEGITSGYADGTFKPATKVDRQALIKFLYEATHTTPAPACTVRPFNDVPVTHQFCGEISWAKTAGITNGYDGNTFRPGELVSRQATAAFIYRLKNPGATPAPCTTAPFTDVPASASFCAEIAWTAAQNIVRGYDNGTFRPGEAVSRDAAVVFIYRAWGPVV